MIKSSSIVRLRERQVEPGLGEEAVEEAGGRYCRVPLFCWLGLVPG
jgi:hypothetical protein